VLIGLEATGHYWWALYEYLSQYAYPVVALNALQVHAFRKSGLRKVKNDRTDAVWIGEFWRFSQPAPAKPVTSVFLQLKEISRFRYHLLAQIGDGKKKRLNQWCLLQTEFSDREMNHSCRIRLKAIPLHQQIEGGNDERHARESNPPASDAGVSGDIRSSASKEPFQSSCGYSTCRVYKLSC